MPRSCSASIDTYVGFACLMSLTSLKLLIIVRSFADVSSLSCWLITPGYCWFNVNHCGTVAASITSCCLILAEMSRLGKMATRSSWSLTGMLTSDRRITSSAWELLGKSCAKNRASSRFRITYRSSASVGIDRMKSLRENSTNFRREL